MSGRHDRSGDDEQAANLLRTGPIVIRGLGRGMKDALLPGRPSRHRAFVHDAVEEVPGGITPVGEMLADGPVAPEGGASSPLPAAGEEHRSEPGRTDPAEAGAVQGEHHDATEEAPMDDAAQHRGPHDDGTAGREPEEPEPRLELVRPVPAERGVAAPDDGEALAEPDAEAPVARATGDVLWTLARPRFDARTFFGDPMRPAVPAPAASATADVLWTLARPRFDARTFFGDPMRPTAAAAAPVAAPRPDAVPAPDAAHLDRAPSRQDPAVEPDDLVAPGDPLDDAQAAEAEQHTPVAPAALDVLWTLARPRFDARTFFGDPMRPRSAPAEGPDPAAHPVPDAAPAASRAEDVLWTLVRPRFDARTFFGDPMRAPATAPAAAPEPAPAPDPEPAPEPEPEPESSRLEVAGSGTSSPAERVRSGDLPPEPTPVLLPEPTPALGGAAPGRPADQRVAEPRRPGTRRPVRRSLRDRVSREAIGIAVLVVLALVCAGLIAAVVVKTRNDAAIAAREAAQYTPPPLTTPTPAPTGPVVAVVGDGTTSLAGVASSQRWTHLLEQDLGGRVDTSASAGAGYVTKGADGRTFVQAAADVPSGADVVVLFGGTADSGASSITLTKAATQAYAAAAKRAPHARLLVVGPAISAGAAPASVTALRSTLHGAADTAKARWVDPIGAGWLPAAAQGAGSAKDLTAADEKAIATRMRTEVQRLTR